MKILKRSVVGFFLLPSFNALTVGKWICLSHRFDPRDLTERFIRHETIHSKQQAEMFWLPFFVWYFLEWIVRIFTTKQAYRNISFEREAYTNEANSDYLCKRKKFSWWRYL